VRRRGPREQHCGEPGEARREKREKR
jgi:hypothetical protein